MFFRDFLAARKWRARAETGRRSAQVPPRWPTSRDHRRLRPMVRRSDDAQLCEHGANGATPEATVGTGGLLSEQFPIPRPELELVVGGRAYRPNLDGQIAADACAHVGMQFVKGGLLHTRAPLIRISSRSSAASSRPRSRSARVGARVHSDCRPPNCGCRRRRIWPVTRRAASPNVPWLARTSATGVSRRFLTC